MDRWRCVSVRSSVRESEREREGQAGEGMEENKLQTITLKKKKKKTSLSLKRWSSRSSFLPGGDDRKRVVTRKMKVCG